MTTTKRGHCCSRSAFGKVRFSGQKCHIFSLSILQFSYTHLLFKDRLCQETDGCKYWTFYPGGKKCWSKTSSVGFRPNNDRISGSKGCSGTKHYYTGRG